LADDRRCGLSPTAAPRIYRGGIGIVQAYDTLVVRSRIQGQHAQIAFTEGQAVDIA
jgi:hypothetical protein